MKNKIIHYSLLLLVALWPFTRELHGEAITNFSSGKWNSWQAISIQPLFLLLLPIIFFLVIKKTQKTKLAFLITLGLLLFSQLLTSGNWALLLNMLFILGIVFAFNNLKPNKKFRSLFINIFSGVAVFQVLLAAYQVISTHSLGLKILNEPVLGLAIKGVAKFNVPFLGQELLRGYGTFAHPNILAAFLIIGYFTLRNSSTKIHKVIQYIILIGLTLTFSRLILIAFVFELYLQYKKRHSILKPLTITLGLCMLVVLTIRTVSPHTTISNQERITQTFSPIITSNTKSAPWEIVPVHNSYILLVDNLGINGIFLITFLFLFILNTPKNNRLTLLMVIAIFDHFLLTLPIGSYFFLLAMYPLNQSLPEQTDLPAV